MFNLETPVAVPNNTSHNEQKLDLKTAKKTLKKRKQKRKRGRDKEGESRNVNDKSLTPFKDNIHIIDDDKDILLGQTQMLS